MNQRMIMIIVAAVAAAGIVFWLFSSRAGSSIGLKAGSSATDVPVNQLLEEAAQSETNGDQVKVKEIYNQILTEYPDYDKIEEVQEKLSNLNVNLIFSNTPVPQAVIHTVVPGDSLGKLSKQYTTTKELIKRSNNLKSDVIRVGQKLRIWKESFSVHVSKSQNTLVLKSGNEVMKIYRVSTGANNSTPVGTFKIATKLANPVWFKPGGEPVPPESPDNQLGSRWMGFDTDPHYGIHGTIEPNLIGQQATAGCVRLVNVDVEELFDLLPVGTEVTIQN